MTAWTRLDPIVLPAFASKDLSQQADAINKRIHAILADRGQYDTYRDRLKNAGPADIDPADLDNAIVFPTNLLGTLQQELRLRHDLDLLEEREHGEMVKASDAAFNDLEAAKQRARAQLAAIGYHDTANTDPDPCRITPDMIHRHPEVHSAQQAADAYRNQLNDRGQRRQANAAAIGQVEEHIRAIRNRVAGI